MVKFTRTGMLGLSNDLVHVWNFRGRPGSASFLVSFTQHKSVDGIKSITILIIKVNNSDGGLLLLHIT